MRPRKAIAAGLALAACCLFVPASPALALTVAATPPGATEGASFNSTVANLTDGLSGLLGCSAANQYTGTVTWGDGTTSPVTVTGGIGLLLGGCLYAVGASHAYAEEGGVSYSVAISSPTASGGTGPAALLVGDAPLSASAVPFTASQGTPAAAAVAAFTDAAPAAAATDFTATIAFGDGTTGVGAVTAAPGGGFAVTATHTYVHSGAYAVATTIKDDGGAQARASTTATVVTTSSVPSKTPPGTPPPAPLKLGLSAPALARGGTVVVGVRCPHAAKLCRGRLTVATVAVPRSPIPALRRAQVLGSTLFLIPGGRRAQLSLRPKRALVAQLRAAGTVAVAAYASSFDAATGRGQVAMLTSKLKLS